MGTHEESNRNHSSPVENLWTCKAQGFHVDPTFLVICFLWFLQCDCGAKPCTFRLTFWCLTLDCLDCRSFLVLSDLCLSFGLVEHETTCSKFRITSAQRVTRRKKRAPMVSVMSTKRSRITLSEFLQGVVYGEVPGRFRRLDQGRSWMKNGGRVCEEGVT